MATVATTTATNSFTGAFGYPPGSMMDLNVQTGELWIVFKDQTNRGAIYKSTDNGASWGFQANFTVSGQTLEDICEMRIDAAGDHIHMVLLTNNGSLEEGHYKRVDIRSGSAVPASGSQRFTGPAGTLQSVEYGGALFPVKNPDGSYHIFLAFSQRGATTGITVYTVTVRNDATLTTYVNNAIIGPTRAYKVSGDDVSTVSMDAEHNGDGITSATPHVWISWQVGSTAYCIKCTWKGYKTGWQTPSKAATVATNRVSPSRDLIGRWDGTRFVILSPAQTSNTVTLYERNTSNTGNAATRTTPAHPIGQVTGACNLSYNYVTKDARVWGISGSGSIYYIDYFRGTNTWGSWTASGWTTPVTSEWGIRRGSYGTAQYDAYFQTGASTPWTVSTLAQTINFAPTAPTWITGTAGTVTVNGAAFDVSSSLLLDWAFNDPNATDVQGSYAVSRQIGVATIQYWRASDSTWQAAEVQNTSATTQLTLTTGQWLGGGGAADAAHTYKVKTWDSGGLASTYSAGLAVVPSTRVDPTLTAPTAAQILNSGTVAVTWTVSEQGSYRVKVVNTVTSVTVYDSGYVTDPTPLSPSVLALTVPVVLPDGFAGQVQLITRNAEGLASLTRTANFTVDFVEPVAPLITALAAAPTLGGINVTVTQPAATGTQPVTGQMDLWRRKATYTVPVNANPYFETNANDWTNSGYSTVARSTTFAHTGVGALLVTPNGSTATPKVQTTALYPVAANTRWEMRVWLRSTTANKTMRIYIDWYNVSSTLISSTTRDLTAVAGVWIWGWVQGTSPDLTTQARIAVGQLATPAAGDTVYIDEAVLIQANDDAGIPIVRDAVTAGTYLDWRAVTGVDYEYRGYAEAANGTSVFGPWSS